MERSEPTTRTGRRPEGVAADLRAREGENQKATFRRGLIRLAAAALGVTYDDLYQRDARRQRARRVAPMVWTGGVAEAMSG